MYNEKDLQISINFTRCHELGHYGSDTNYNSYRWKKGVRRWGGGVEGTEFTICFEQYDVVTPFGGEERGAPIDSWDMVWLSGTMYKRAWRYFQPSTPEMRFVRKTTELTTRETTLNTDSVVISILIIVEIYQTLLWGGGGKGWRVWWDGNMESWLMFADMTWRISWQLQIRK